MRRFMKKLLYIAALLPIMFVQCTKDDIQVEETVKGEYELVNVTFAATFDDEELTKTTLEGGNEIHWKSGDKICIFDNVDPSVKHEFTATVTGDKTSFSGTVAAGATKYFAVYPYSAAVSCDAKDWDNDGKAYAGKLQVEIPEIQEAIEGSFDPAANICMGYTTSTENALNFKIACCLLKFQVKRDDIVAVSFSGSKNMSGSLQLNVTTSGGVGTGDGIGTKLRTITVKKSDGTPFVQGRDYYAVVRYRSGSNAYGSFTADLVAEGGLMATKVASSNLEIERAHIKSIGNFDGLTYEKNLYAYYQLGYPVTIAGKSYNKADDGDAVELSVGQDITTAKLTAKVHFLKAGAAYTASGLTIEKDVVIASEDPENRASITPSSNSKLRSGSLALEGISYNLSDYSGTNLFNNGGTASHFERLAMSKCYVKANSKTKYVYSTATNSGNPEENRLDFAVKQLYFDNCLFETSGTMVCIVMPQSAHTAANMFQQFIFRNNVVYSTGANVGVQLFAFTGTTPSSGWENTVNISNNLFYNVATNGGWYRNYNLKSIMVDNNILFATDGTNLASKDAKMLNIGAEDNENYKSAATSSNNYYYGTLSGSKTWKMGDSKVITGALLSHPSSLASSPIDASTDVSSGKFVLTSAFLSEHSDCGPQPMPVPFDAL